MATKTAICKLEDLTDPGSRGFSVEHSGGNIEGLVIMKDGEIHAYKNQCPHTGSPLDWIEHQFLDLDMTLIQCAVHDARFEIASGLCVAGPCTGDSLESLDVSHDGAQVYLHL